MSSGSWSHELLDSLAHVLREEREKKSMTVYALAQESGVSEQAIHNYEKGDRHPTLERLAHVSWALGMLTSEVIALAEKRIGLMKAP